MVSPIVSLERQCPTNGVRAREPIDPDRVVLYIALYVGNSNPGVSH